MALEMKNLEGRELSYLTELFNYGFEEYLIPMKLTEERVRDLINGEDVDLSLSIEGFHEGKRVGFCWTAVRGDRAWCAGIGVGPEHRGEGYGRELMAHCIKLIRQKGLKTYELECIKENERGIRLYKSLGLKVTGDLYNFKHQLPAPVQIDQESYEIVPGTEIDLMHYWEEFHPVKKSWQGDLPSLLHINDRLEIKLVVRDNTVEGLLVYGENEKMIIIRDIAFKPENKKPGQLALAELHKHGKQIICQFVPEKSSSVELFRETGYEQFIGQVQMLLVL